MQVIMAQVEGKVLGNHGRDGRQGARIHGKMGVNVLGSH